MGHEDLLEAALEAVHAVEAQSGLFSAASNKVQGGANTVIPKKMATDLAATQPRLPPIDADATQPKLGLGDLDLPHPGLIRPRRNSGDSGGTPDETMPKFRGNTGESDDKTMLTGVYSPDDLASTLRVTELEEAVRKLREEADSLRKKNETNTKLLDKITQEKRQLSSVFTQQKAELDELRAALEKEKKDSQQNNERALRVTADFDNYRKRIARDQERMQQQAEEKIMTAFLPVMDNLERALYHSTQTDDPSQLLQGLKMTSKLFLTVLAKFGCMQFKSVGEEFNPAFHDVLQRVIDPEAEHNTVVQEHLSGYLMHKRVLRPALVVVAQHPDAENAPAPEEPQIETAPLESAEPDDAAIDDAAQKDDAINEGE